MKRNQQIKIAEAKLAEAKLNLLKLEEEQLQEGKKLKAAILAAVLALGGMSTASAWGKAKKAPDMDQAIEQAVQKLPKTIEVVDEEGALTEEGKALKDIAQKAGYTNGLGVGMNELCEYLADNDCVMLVNGKPYAKVGSMSTSYKAQSLALERCGLFESTKKKEKKLKEERIMRDGTFNTAFLSQELTLDAVQLVAKRYGWECWSLDPEGEGAYDIGYLILTDNYNGYVLIDKDGRGYKLEITDKNFRIRTGDIQKTDAWKGVGFSALKHDLYEFGKVLFDLNEKKSLKEKKLKEEVYINGPENVMKLYIIKEDEPQYFYGVIYALKKFVGMRLNINLQKIGYKTTQARPEICIYARGMPSEFEIFDSNKNETCVYVQFDEKDIFDAIKQTAEEMKLQIGDMKEFGGIPEKVKIAQPSKNFLKESETQIQSREFGDWAVCFWKKGSHEIHIAKKMENGRWMFGGGKRKFDYESGWLPGDFEWCAKGYFSKEDAIKNAKESAMNEPKTNRKKSLKEKRVPFIGSDPNVHDPTSYFAEVGLVLKDDQIYDKKGRWIGLWDCTPNNYYISLGGEDLKVDGDIIWEGHSLEELKEDLQDFVIAKETWR